MRTVAGLGHGPHSGPYGSWVKDLAGRTTYLNPKIYDDSTYEAAEYDERRDDIGRLMRSVMMQVRNRLATH